LEDIDPDPYPALLNSFADQFFIGFPIEAGLSLIVLVVLVIASALVSGSETAFFSLSLSNLEALRQSGHKKDKLILELKSKPKRLLATILISNNFINVGIVILSTYITTLLFNLAEFPVLSFIIQVVVITSVILIFGEIIPKILANKEPVMVANLMANPLNFLIAFFKPLSFLLVKSTVVIDKKLGVKGHNISASDFSEAIEITVDDSVREDEKNILRGIASFIEKEASEIMQSRVNVTAIDSELSFDEVMALVQTSGFSRIPVYEESLDRVLGILYIKDLLPFIESQKQVDWLKLVRPAIFVPENKRINDLLQEFRLKKIHLAIVVDEYGGTSGIVTLEDIIEEIVGEISDEFDKVHQQNKFRKLTPDTYLFEAKIPLNDMCKILKIDDDYFEEVRGESDSLGGLILELEGKIPIKGTVIKFQRFEFTIMDVTARKIKEVQVKIKTKKVSDES
jgi:gliding motility-associated protein GldE